MQRQLVRGSIDMLLSCVYTRVLTRVQLASGRECGLSQSGLQSGWGRSHWR